jgi:alpha/beta superfamily hydrolase
VTVLVVGVGVLLFTLGLSPLVLLRLQISTTPFTTQTVDGIHIRYDVTMKAKTSLNAPISILLHGFSGNRIMMRMITFALADQGFICVSVDLRGHGSSEGLMGERGNFKSDVDAVLHSLHMMEIGNLSRLVLIGHSMGGGISLIMGSQLTSAVATIGIAPVSSPDWVTTTTPKNLLLIHSTGDTVINSTALEQTFYKSVNGTLSFNTLHHVFGTERELFIINSVDHFNILYHDAVIDEIVKWSTRTVFGVEHSRSINPELLNNAVYVSLLGGTILILATLSLIHGKLRQETEQVNERGEFKLRTLLKMGCIAIVLCGGIGSFITLGFVYLFQLFTPLFFTNFITALFFGNAIMYGLLTRKNLRARNTTFSYRHFIKNALKTPSLKGNTLLGLLGATAFVVLFALTLGSSTTATFSTATLRILSLPFYIMLFVFVFIFYESFFKGYARPMMGSGMRQRVSSVLFESVVLLLTVLLELVVITTLLSQVMPFISLGFIALGLNLLLIALLTSLVSTEVLYAKTGGWISQSIISAVIFATLTTVFSPALRFF